MGDLSIRKFVKASAETLPISEPIYEFGAFQVQGQEVIANLRSLFPGKKFIGTDMRKSPGVDLVLNLHNIDLPSNQAGTVICLETLEHVEFPRKAIEEIYRILKPEGILLISAPFSIHIHGVPHDYWRFTTDGYRSLLKPFNTSFVDFYGSKGYPRTIIGVGFKGSIAENNLNNFKAKIKTWKAYWTDQTGSWKKLVKKVIPPILLPVISKIHRKLRGYEFYYLP